VAGLVAFGLVFCIVLLLVNLTARESGEPKLQGHVWDETLREYNNPLPKWWLWLFWGTLAFAIVYLAIFPGFGAHNAGAGLRAEYDKAKGEFDSVYAGYATQSVEDLAKNSAALETGKRLFLTYCANCHGSDGTGVASNFPNLTDADSLYGIDAASIKESIEGGRSGAMTAAADLELNETQINDVANYVRTLSGLEADAASAAEGRKVFLAGVRNEDGTASFTKCAMCHGADGKGSVAHKNGLGAPDLTDKVWLYGSSLEAIKLGITKGRNAGDPETSGNVMPTWGKFLGNEGKVNVLAAYVYSLSHQ